MATRRYDLAVKTGAYEKNGETKGRYMNVGVVMENDNGMFMLLDPAFNPAGVPREGDRVMVSMFEPRRRDEGSQGGDFNSPPSRGGYDDSSEIPF